MLKKEMSTSEVASYLMVDPSTIRRNVRKHDVKVKRNKLGYMRFSKTSITKLVKKMAK